MQPCRLVQSLPTISPFSVCNVVQMPEYRAILSSQEACTVSLWSPTLYTAKSRVKNSNNQALLGTFPPTRTVGDLKRNYILQAIPQEPHYQDKHEGKKEPTGPSTNTRV